MRARVTQFSLFIARMASIAISWRPYRLSGGHLAKSFHFQLLIVVLALCTSLAAVAEQKLVSAIVINRQNVFSDDQVRERLGYRAANAIHAITRERTILRELGIEAGDRVSDDDVARIERRLRGLGIFASVNVRLVDEAGLWQLHVDTRDQLTLIASASGSFVGGVGEVGVTVGERNLLGTGDSLTVGFTGNTRDETLGAISYRDLHLADGKLSARYQFGRTEEGGFGGVLLSRPFRDRAQRRSWSLSANNASRDIDFYANAASVIQVPEEQSRLVYRSTWRRGPAERERRRGFSLSATQTQYQPARGIDATSITVPADNRVLSGGVTLGLNRLQEFRRITRLDTLGFVQDIRLGTTLSVTAGLNVREDLDADSRLEPLLRFNATRALAFGDRRLLATRVNATVSPVPDADDSWSYTLALHGYALSRLSHTLALRLDLRVADNGDRLPAQFTLGENNGLRGYPARQFSGARQLRLNLEDRIRTSWRLGPLNIGALAFFDAGWIAAEGESLALAGSSVGLGLRLGSSPLMGAAVMRIDIAMPLNSIDGDREPMLSVALGQVFGFQP